MTSLTIPARFNGPPHSGNGGWTSGAVAALLGPPPGGAVRVRLSAPPPLDVEMEVEKDVEMDLEGPQDGAVVVRAAGAEVARAELVDDPFTDHAPEPVSWDVAGDAAARYRGLADHPFPTCFTCGLERPAGDGLRLTPGPLTDRPDVTACGWTPTDADIPTTWAALDCPGGWSIDLAGRPMVLGTMTARLDSLPRLGRRHVVMGRVMREEGRKAWTQTALYALEPSPRLLARAAAVWIAVDPAAVRPLRSAQQV